MIFTPQSIPDVILISPTIHRDDRGYFVETFRQDLLEKYVGHKVDFIQDGESKSSKGVLRGFHYQIHPRAQAKLIRVVKGSILDIAVDIRKSSNTFGQSVSIELNSDNKHQVYIPHGFAHGFLVLSDSATLVYKVDNYYSKEFERGISFSCDNLAIDYQLKIQNVTLSEKDRKSPSLSCAIDLFD